MHVTPDNKVRTLSPRIKPHGKLNSGAAPQLLCGETLGLHQCGRGHPAMQPWGLEGTEWLSGTTAHHHHRSQGGPRQPFLCLKKNLGLLPAAQLTGCCGAERPLSAHPPGRAPGSSAGQPGPCKHHGCSASPAVLLPRGAWSCCSFRGQHGGPWGHCAHCVPTLSPVQQRTSRQGGKAKRWTIPQQAEPGNFQGMAPA